LRRHPIHFEDQASCGAILDPALTNPEPVLTETVVGPFEPMPPKIRFYLRRVILPNPWRAVNPTQAKIAWTVLSDKVRELI
jgi:hypothetical protein